MTEGISVAGIVDLQSVTRLQTLAPYHSTVDCEEVSNLITTHSIFTRVSSQEDRDALKKNIHSIRTTIPSLYTFFEDMKYLEPCAKVLRALLPPRTKQSTYCGLTSIYRQPKDILVEHTHNDLRVHACERHAARLGIQQLWLFVLRNFPLMTNFTTRKAFDKDKPNAIEPSPTVWQEFGALARRLGFYGVLVSDLETKDPTGALVCQLLDRYAEGSSKDQAAADKIGNILRSIRGQRVHCKSANFVSTQRQIAAVERCGRPFEDDHHNDKACLYLPEIYRASHRGFNITTFYRKWCMFRAFMGIEEVGLVRHYPIAANIFVVKVVRGGCSSERRSR